MTTEKCQCGDELNNFCDFCTSWEWGQTQLGCACELTHRRTQIFIDKLGKQLKTIIHVYELNKLLKITDKQQAYVSYTAL